MERHNRYISESARAYGFPSLLFILLQWSAEEVEQRVAYGNGWIVMLHIPRDGRLKDPVNLTQMGEIERSFPGVRLIIAHVGRVYCPEEEILAFKLAAGSVGISRDDVEGIFYRNGKSLIEAASP